MALLRGVLSCGLVFLTLQVHLASPAAAAEYAPLNCARAASEAEKTICSNYGLGQDEARMATLYALTTSLVAMGQRGNIQDEQRAFISKREACRSNVDCIRNLYAARIRQLDGVMAGIIARGPF